MKTLIVGLGSPQGDDQFGWRVIDVLEGKTDLVHQWRLFRSNAKAMDWFGEVEDSELVVFVDGVKGNGKTGEIVVLTEEELPKNNLAPSSHAIPFAESVELVKQLFGMQLAVYFVGVEIGDTVAMTELSQEVARAVPEVVNIVEKLSLDVV